jgi:hypothetical protein
MNFHDEISYMNIEGDDIFLSWYEIEGVRTITELSRQIRTLLKYRAAIIQYRFRTDHINPITTPNIKFLEAKNKFESLALKFIKLLRKIKDFTGNLGGGYQYLLDHASSNKTENLLLKKLEDVTNHLFIQIHYFSEQKISEHPSFFKMIILLAQEVCETRISLKKQFFGFYEELGKNYHNLEKELSILILSGVQEKFDERKRKMSEMIKS